MKPQATLGTTAIVLRVVFFVLLLALAWSHVTILFSGLNTRHGMEQADIARNIASGKGITTNVIYPAAVHRNLKATNGQGTLADVAANTYHAPLNPMLLSGVFRAVGADKFDKWRFRANEYVYQLDRVVAAFSIACFLIAIGVSYLLICRIFDARLAGAVAILMLFCELFWNISMSGLPQMLMLLLFSCGCFFAYRAFEASSEGESTILHSLLAAIFFTLLCLTHWLAVWILLGYALSAAIFIRPRGVAGLIALVALALAAILPILQNLSVTGSPVGLAYLVLYEGLSLSEDYALRSMGEVALNLRGFVFQVLRLTITQTTDLYSYFGAILAAPLFFVALFHPFKRPSISSFRWALLIMWLFAAFGMALFGLSDGEMDANQLHLLFAPIFSAYGLAMLTVLWGRLNISQSLPMLEHSHLVLVVLISSAPFLLKMPKDVYEIMQSKGDAPPNYPPYAPSVLDETIVDFVEPNEILASDQPWAVAWYANRRCVWLPLRLDDLEDIESMSDSEETPIVGVLTSPISSGIGPLQETYGLYGDYLSLMLDGWASVSTGIPTKGIVSGKDPDLTAFYSRYPHSKQLFFRFPPTILYSSRRSGTSR